MYVYSQVLSKILLWSWAEFTPKKKKREKVSIKVRSKILPGGIPPNFWLMKLTPGLGHCVEGPELGALKAQYKGARSQNREPCTSYCLDRGQRSNTVCSVWSQWCTRGGWQKAPIQKSTIRAIYMDYFWPNPIALYCIFQVTILILKFWSQRSKIWKIRNFTNQIELQLKNLPWLSLLSNCTALRYNLVWNCPCN